MQIPSPLVSVIIPVYNGASFLRQALESVWAQTFNDYETIVIDDASTDDTPDIIRAYGDRIHARYRKENSKTADIPRYEGVEQSTGMFCAFLDADDLWTPTKLEKQVAFMRSHPDVPL